MKTYLFIFIIIIISSSTDSVANTENSNRSADIAKKEIESPYTYEYRKNKGVKMSFNRLMELKDRLIGLTEAYPTDDSEEYRLLHETSSIVLLGLYFRDTELAHNFLNEVKNNLLTYFNKRGDDPWKRDDREDGLFLRKFTLYSILLEGMLSACINEKKHDLCLDIINENCHSPFFQARYTTTKYLLRLYNDTVCHGELKNDLDKIFDAMIEKEKIALDETNGQEDFMRSRAGSKALIQILIDKKETETSFSIQ